MNLKEENSCFEDFLAVSRVWKEKNHLKIKHILQEIKHILQRYTNLDQINITGLCKGITIKIIHKEPILGENNTLAFQNNFLPPTDFPLNSLGQTSTTIQHKKKKAHW